MTQEQYKFLNRFKDNFKTAAFNGYSRNISRPDRRRLRQIYEELSGKKHEGNIYCSECLVDMLIILKEYYDKGVIKTEDNGEEEIRKVKNLRKVQRSCKKSLTNTIKKGIARDFLTQLKALV